MSVEELGFVLNGLANGDSLFDIELGAALHAKVSQLEWIDCALKKFQCVCTRIHQINLSYDANRAITLRVHLSRQLQRIGVSQVLSRRR